MKYVIGLDLGIASIGWATYDIETQKIETTGVRLFDSAENPDDKSSLAMPRRLARGQRRTIRRRSYRIKKIKQLFIEHNLITDNDLESLYNSIEQNNKHLYDVYYLRYTALTTLLTNKQISKILIHLAKHRGFKSNKKKDKSVDGKIIENLKTNQEIMEENKYRSIGEMLYLHPNFTTRKRNTVDEYKSMTQRSDTIKEAELILKTQQTLGNTLLDNIFIEKYLVMLQWQKNFDWMGNITEMVGSCQFEKDEKRAPKACFSSEKFIALSKLNNIRYNVDSTELSLTIEQINKIMNLAFTRTAKKLNITFETIRKELNIPTNARFNFVKYNNDNYIEAEKNEKIKELEMRSYHELKSCICDNVGVISWKNLSLNTHLLDQIAISLTYNKTDESIRTSLQQLFINHNLPTHDQEQIINAIIDTGISFDKNINLSLMALYKIIPYLEKALTYDKRQFDELILVMY